MIWSSFKKSLSSIFQKESLNSLVGDPVKGFMCCLFSPNKSTEAISKISIVADLFIYLAKLHNQRYCGQ